MVRHQLLTTSYVHPLQPRWLSINVLFCNRLVTVLVHFLIYPRSILFSVFSRFFLSLFLPMSSHPPVTNHRTLLNNVVFDQTRYGLHYGCQVCNCKQQIWGLSCSSRHDTSCFEIRLKSIDSSYTKCDNFYKDCDSFYKDMAHRYPREIETSHLFLTFADLVYNDLRSQAVSLSRPTSITTECAYTISRSVIELKAGEAECSRTMTAHKNYAMHVQKSLRYCSYRCQCWLSVTLA